MEEGGEGPGIARSRLHVVGDGLAVFANEKQAEHRADAIERDRDIAFDGGRGQACDQICAGVFQLLVGTRFLQNIQRRDAGIHRQRIAAQCAGLINRAGGADLFHDLTASAVGTHRQATADHFSEASDIRFDIVPDLRPTPGDAETGHHFVEQQQNTVLRAKFPESFEISDGGDNQAHVARDRLDGEAGDFVAMEGKKFAGGVQVVIRNDQRA